MRIIAGDFAKRNLYTLKSNSTRPTSDKVKGSLFNVLGQFFNSGNVLDLYAGSGALGIEAVSRGYSHATLVDINHNAIEVIKKNVALTREEAKFSVYKMSDFSALKMLATKQTKFDLVFLDPPYAKQKIAKVMSSLIKDNLLNSKARVVAETDENISLDSNLDGYVLLKKHQLGRTILWFYQKKE